MLGVDETVSDEMSAVASKAPPRTDLTDSLFKGYVRTEEYWPEDSPQYKAGCDIANRKRPPADEVPGDVFDRQRVIYGFDQGLIERQVCLVLGAGGIGMDVALTLGRLGVGRIIVVDNDTYDASNLTRQCLGSLSDVGKRKVDVAASTLRQHHSLRSEVDAVHCDVLVEWPRIVKLAREATLVVNAIDVGVMWDYCINSLCKELGVPLVAGQSFAWKFMTEFYTGVASETCAFCHESTRTSFSASAALVKQGGVLERLERFLTSSRDNDDIASFLEEDPKFRCSGSALLRDMVKNGLSRAGLTQFRRGEGLTEDLVGFLTGLWEEMSFRLLPGAISDLADIAFIPRPEHAETRFIGSWVCPCLACAVHMVSQWTAWLTAVPELDSDGGWSRNPPQTVTFNLDFGMTSEEQLGYELGGLAMPMDKGERRYCREVSNTCCAVCKAASELRARESLYVGKIPVVLAPVPGEACASPVSWTSPVLDVYVRAAATAKAVARRALPSDMESEYAQTVLPAIPALDWVPEEDSTARSTWPQSLAVCPLLKVPMTSEAATVPSALMGVASGVRSALVRLRGRWWRLKGCGNRDEAFPLEAKGDMGELSIRGCCFEHTANAELRMTDLVNEALQAVCVDCANQSAGVHKYTSDPAWPLPKITRCCAVFETLGNKRLGDHLIAGILLLLPHVVPAHQEGLSHLRHAVARARGVDGDDLWPTATGVACGMPVADVIPQMSSVGMEEVSPPDASSSELQGVVPHDLARVWSSARTTLGERLAGAKQAAKEPSLLLWLCWRLGWECGVVLRTLHGAGIAWGTFPDAMGIHCNAHANNFVVKPPGSGNFSTFLAPLDFDMAFTEEGFLPEAVTSHLSLGLDSWSGVLNFEATMGLKPVLAGDDFANTGVTNRTVMETHVAVEMAMRDTLVAAFDEALAGGVDAHPDNDAMHFVAERLIELALCLTTDVEG